MENYSGIFLIFLCMAVIFVAGCTSQTAPAASTITSTPPTSIPTTVMTSFIIPLIPTIAPNVTAPSIVPIKTPSPKADATDLSEITFLHYSDNDFSVDYPSTWTIAHSTYTPYPCKSVTDTTRNDYHICFQNETKSIGPFNFYEDITSKTPSRIVTFTSADGKLKFVSFTTDFIDGYIGAFRLSQTPDWCRARFDSSYPDLKGRDYVGNYKFTQPASNSFGVATYDVTMPKGSQYYPLAYTVKTFVNMRKENSFAFITDNENFNKYQNLKEFMLSSITTEG